MGTRSVSNRSGPRVKCEYTKEDMLGWFADSVDAVLHFLLRDNVGHKEGDGDLGADREAFLERVGIAETVATLQSKLDSFVKEVAN